MIVTKEKGDLQMKNFYAGTFMNRTELAKEGIFYPIKLEYYKVTEVEEGREIYGIEVIKTKYNKQEPEIERETKLHITDRENEIHRLLNCLKEGEVTPTQLEYVIRDLTYVAERIELSLEA